MSNYLQKISPTANAVTKASYRQAAPGALGAVAGYIAADHLGYKKTGVGALVGLSAGEILTGVSDRGMKANLYALGINALGILGALWLPEKLGYKASKYVAPAVGYLAGKGVGVAAASFIEKKL